MWLFAQCSGNSTRPRDSHLSRSSSSNFTPVSFLQCDMLHGPQISSYAIKFPKQTFTVLLWGKCLPWYNLIWFMFEFELCWSSWDKNALTSSYNVGKLHLVCCVLVHKSNSKLHLRQSPIHVTFTKHTRAPFVSWMIDLIGWYKLPVYQNLSNYQQQLGMKKRQLLSRYSWFICQVFSTWKGSVEKKNPEH